MRQVRCDAGRKRRKVNGVGRNEVVSLTPDELQAMTDEIRTVRHTDGLTHKQRRAEYVLRRKEQYEN
jgi:hypothetical protein